MESKIFCVCNDKGGVGKTAVATHFAMVMKRDFGMDVAVVDADYTQLDAGVWLKDGKYGVKYIPTNRETLGDVAKNLRNIADVVIVDMNPKISLDEYRRFFQNSDYLIVPFDGGLAIKNARLTLGTWKSIKGEDKKSLIFGILTLVDRAIRISGKLIRSALEYRIMMLPMVLTNIGKTRSEYCVKTGKPYWKKALRVYDEYLTNVMYLIERTDLWEYGNYSYAKEKEEKV